MRKFPILFLIGIFIVVCLSSSVFARDRNFSVYGDLPISNSHIDTNAGTFRADINKGYALGMMSPTYRDGQVFVGRTALNIDVRVHEGNKTPPYVVNIDAYAWEAGLQAFLNSWLGIQMGFLAGGGAVEYQKIGKERTTRTNISGYKIAIEFEVSPSISIPVAFRYFLIDEYMSSLDVFSAGLQWNF